MSNGLGLFLAAALKGFSNSKARKQEREEQEQEKKARTKLFELQFAQLQREMQKEAQAEQRTIEQGRAKDAFFQEALNATQGVRTQRLPGTGVALGDVGQPGEAPVKRGLVDVLADPEMLLKGVQAGVVSSEALTPKPVQETDAIRTLRALAADPTLMAAEIARQSAGATKIDTGDKMGRIPEGHALVTGPDGKPMLQRLEGKATPGQDKLDEVFAADYAEYVAGGGFADAQKQISQLQDARNELSAVVESQKSGKKVANITGPGVGNTPDLIRQVSHPRSLAVRDNVEEVVQRNLRLILGAQFTAQEGERLIARAYNERQTESENVTRLDRLLVQMKEAAAAKQRAVEYFEEHGSLTGFKGKLWTINDFNPEAAPPQGFPADAVQVGTSGGKPVYETPDGKRWIAE